MKIWGHFWLIVRYYQCSYYSYWFQFWYFIVNSTTIRSWPWWSNLGKTIRTCLSLCTCINFICIVYIICITVEFVYNEQACNEIRLITKRILNPNNVFITQNWHDITKKIAEQTNRLPVFRYARTITY